MPWQFHPPWLDHCNYTCRRVQVMKLLIMQFSSNTTRPKQNEFLLHGATKLSRSSAIFFLVKVLVRVHTRVFVVWHICPHSPVQVFLFTVSFSMVFLVEVLVRVLTRVFVVWHICPHSPVQVFLFTISFSMVSKYYDWKRNSSDSQPPQPILCSLGYFVILSKHYRITNERENPTHVYFVRN
jgi:hypothetical protein